MDTLAPATLDAHGLSTREINDRLRELLDDGAGTVDVLHPGSRHSLAVGFLDHPGAAVRFRGDVGYFCGGLSDGLDVAVDGNAGWSLGADMMDGSIVVGGNSGSSTGASMRGGLVVVRGDAGARSAIAGKGSRLRTATAVATRATSTIDEATTCPLSAKPSTRARLRMTISAGWPASSRSRIAPTALNVPLMSNPSDALATSDCAAPPARIRSSVIAA